MIEKEGGNLLGPPMIWLGFELEKQE